MENSEKMGIATNNDLHNLNIAVINVLNHDKKIAMNKDLNGGFGTADFYSGSILTRIIKSVKKNSIRIPIPSLAFLMGIFKQKNIPAKYYEGPLPEDNPDIVLIYGSIVDYKNENNICKLLKNKFPDAKVGFIGPFPTTKPDLFESGDFVMVGDYELFFLKNFMSKDQLNGRVTVLGKVDLDELPQPELDGFPIKEYGYFPAIRKKPFFAILASKGCPMTCSYYCIYGAFQGPKIRGRSPQKVVQDMVYLNKKWGIKGFQFRDPVFGMASGFIEEFCEELKKADIKDIEWGIETRIDILNEEKIKLMYDVGMRNLNIGVETINKEIAKKNKRMLGNIANQEKLLAFCKKLGVRISAFFIFGYEGDTRETIEESLKYAMKINTNIARFAVNTPYPGAKYFDQIENENRILTYDYEKYTQFYLVFKHENFTPEEMNKIVANAYSRYYFRPSYIFSFLKSLVVK